MNDDHVLRIDVGNLDVVVQISRHDSHAMEVDTVVVVALEDLLNLYYFGGLLHPYYGNVCLCHLKLFLMMMCRFGLSLITMSGVNDDKVLQWILVVPERCLQYTPKILQRLTEWLDRGQNGPPSSRIEHCGLHPLQFSFSTHAFHKTK